MKYLKYTYVDAKTQKPVTQAPAKNGPRAPQVDGLQFRFALESEYPTNTPTFYGVCPDSSDINIPGVLGDVTTEEYTEAYNKELEARKEMARSNVDQVRDSVLFGAIPYTFPGDTESDHIQVRDERDRQNIQDNVIDAGNRSPEEIMYFMPMSNNLKTLSAAQMVEMGKYLKARGDDIYQVAWSKKNQGLAPVNTFEELLQWQSTLHEGWPEQ